MKPELMNQILIEAIGLPPDVPIESITLKAVSASVALNAMQRAVEEETARLKQCYAIVRELAEDSNDSNLWYYRNTARQWVKNNPK